MKPAPVSSLLVVAALLVPLVSPHTTRASADELPKDTNQIKDRDG